MSVCADIAKIIKDTCGVDAFDGRSMGSKAVGALVTETMSPETVHPSVPLAVHHLYVEVVDRYDGRTGSSKAFTDAMKIRDCLRCSIGEFEGYPRIVTDPPYEVYSGGDVSSYRMLMTVDRRE